MPLNSVLYVIVVVVFFVSLKVYIEKKTKKHVLRRICPSS